MTDAKTLAERLRWLSHNSGWGDDATAKAAAELIERQNAELAALRADYENACKLVADMHTAAMGANVGPVVGVVEDVAALRADAERLRIRGEAYEAAFHIAYRATYQSHSGHWDRTMQGGAGCPECIKAREARAECDKVLREGLQRLADAAKEQR